jgi:O-antigen biosynthesis protein
MPGPMKNRSIMVLGMHRSGTSAFTGVLGLLGVDLGSKLMPASSANEAGYWEHQEIVNVHERLLGALGSHWDDPSRLPEGWWKLEAVAPYRRKLIDIIARDFSASPLWGLKDPRMCRLLPLWTSMLDELECQVVWVLVTRHPSENIRSLGKRDGFSPEKSGLLWLQHTLDAERETRNRNRVIITYDQLLENWDGTLERVRRAAGVPWPVPPEVAAARIKEFVDPGKRHHQASTNGELPRWIREAYEGLQAGAAGDEEKMRALVGPAQDAFDAADALYRPVIRDRAADLELRLTEVNAQYSHLSQAHEGTREKYRLAKEKLAVKSAEAKALKERVREYERSPAGKLNRVLSRFKGRKDG